MVRIFICDSDISYFPLLPAFFQRVKRPVMKKTLIILFGQVTAMELHGINIVGLQALKAIIDGTHHIAVTKI
ncbi:hypothetical protein SD70_28040 [Gordoniibacillus kamchatkensis]|uniref:STAS domain-containing protein n=1 Tax=Gordoniibacillus kamchatkensis TaxID=1590651 RepID=A0ABR5ABB0_9BACL|nr:hypothetical protein SD70_28040 [Paenibacillus sp. VKM B-2647]